MLFAGGVELAGNPPVDGEVHRGYLHALVTVLHFAGFSAFPSSFFSFFLFPEFPTVAWWYGTGHGYKHGTRIWEHGIFGVPKGWYIHAAS